MSSFGRPVLAVALLLMLAPLSRDAGFATAGAAGAGVELVYTASRRSRDRHALTGRVTAGRCSREKAFIADKCDSQ